jgi:hypothetical protein
MKLSFRALSLASCMAVLLAVTSTAAYADVVATVYEGIPDPTNANDPANFASALPHGTFTVSGSGINFASPTDSNLATFLNNPIYTSTTAGFNPTENFLAGIELVITGNIFLNSGLNSFVVGHDDGVVLTIPGIISTGNTLAGPSSFTTTPISVNNPGAAGVFSFTLDYAECCSAPADLLFTVNGAPVVTTPEPSSIALFGTGLFAAAGLVRRRIFS